LIHFFEQQTGHSRLGFRLSQWLILLDGQSSRRHTHTHTHICGCRDPAKTLESRFVL